jgi:anti-sigma factor ChrR (cupin superfamily)
MRGLCRDVAEKLLLYRDGTLPEADVIVLHDHLQYCPPCLDLLDSYEQVVAILASLRPVGMPPGLMERVKAHLEQARTHRADDPAAGEPGANDPGAPEPGP